MSLTMSCVGSRCVDCFQVDSPITSLTMSPTNDFLATTHVDDLGVYLWSNMTLYTHVALRPLPADFTPVVMTLPSTSNESQGQRQMSMSDLCIKLILTPQCNVH